MTVLGRRLVCCWTRDPPPQTYVRSSSPDSHGGASATSARLHTPPSRLPRHRQDRDREEACTTFEQGARHGGEGLPPGLRGAHLPSIGLLDAGAGGAGRGPMWGEPPPFDRNPTPRPMHAGITAGSLAGAGHQGRPTSSSSRHRRNLLDDTQMQWLRRGRGRPLPVGPGPGLAR